MKVTCQIAVIGGGPAGMAAAVAAYDRGCRDIVILDREDAMGGILRQCIHPGFGLHRLGRELTGPEYAAEFAAMVRDRGIPVYTGTTVTEISRDRVITARNRQGILTIHAAAVILAMGCRERSRGQLTIPGSRPAGVYTAGTAQKLVNSMGYRVGSRAVILGSGDIGLIMARRLTLEGAKVEAVCEVMSYSGCLARNITQCLEDFGIPLYLSTTVTKIHGRKRVEGVTAAQVDDRRRPIAGTERYIPCDTLLLSCGLIPENELSRAAGVLLDPDTSGPVVDQNRETTVPGIFACGNVLHVHDLVDHVSREAELAGQAAADFVLGKASCAQIVATEAGQGVRYVLPQRLKTGTGEPVELYFRPAAPMGACRIRVCCGGREAAAFSRLHAAPGEMERITLPPAVVDALDATVTVVLEEEI